MASNQPGLPIMGLIVMAELLVIAIGAYAIWAMIT